MGKAAALKSLVEDLAATLQSLTPGQRAKTWAVIERKLTKIVDTPARRAATRHSTSWKGLEREVAEALGGKRISRGDNFAREDVDVEVLDFPLLKIDAKYRNKHTHHTFVFEIIRKYCNESEWPVLVTKHKSQTSCYVTVPIELFAALLNIARSSNSALPRRNEDAETT